MGFRATGTMHNNRIEHFPLVPISGMKKMETGGHDHRSSAADKIEIKRWHDNSVVTVGSNAYGLLSLRKVKRWKKGEVKGHVNDQPTSQPTSQPSLSLTIMEWMESILWTEGCWIVG